MRTPLLMLLLAACGRPEPTDPRTPAAVPLTATTAQSADATIENGLPYDGCSYPVTINGIDYAPSAKSRDAVIAFVGGTGHVPARVEFKPTGGSAEVTCGWNNTRTLPEIDISSIAAK
jgi:hypothetical protein